MSHLALVFLAFTFLPFSGPSAVGLSPAAAPPAAVAPLADDIVRRLHRMGFDAIKEYNARPPERDGELCLNGTSAVAAV